MTLRRQPFPIRRPESPIPALALAIALTCSALGQEPAPETPPPAIPPESGEKMPETGSPALPGDQTLVPEPGAIPIREYRRMRPANPPEWMEEEAEEPVEVTEPPAPPIIADPDVSREVAMSQALSTGETLLGGLGGLSGVLYSPFLTSPLLSPLQRASALEPMRLGSLDVNVHGSLGVTGTHLGGGIYNDRYSASPLFQGGFTMSVGRNTLSSLWLTYDIGSSYPENPSQGRQLGGDSGSSDGFEQSLSLMAKVVFPEMRRVKFVFGLKYASLSGFDRDTAGGGKRQIATGLFITSYDYSEKTSFDWDVSVPVREFSDGVSSSGVTSTVFGYNQVTRKTRIGLGYSIGSLNVEDGKDQVFQQALLRVKYKPTRFLQCDVTAGVDFRDQGSTFAATPIFGLSAVWDSERGTTVSLAAERRIFNAASVINTNFSSTSIVLSAGQRLGFGVIGSLSAGYEYTEYDSIGAGGEGQRKDKLSYLSGGLHLPVSRHWSFSLNCSAGKNKSDVAAFDFVQTTLKTSLAF